MKKSDRCLVIFDVEGVLLPKRRFLLFEVSAKLGLSTFLKFLLIGILYEIGLLSMESALRRLFRLLKGMPMDEMFSQFRRLSPIRGATELFGDLKKLGFKSALISSGLPRVFVEDLAHRLSADYASGLEIGIDGNGHLTGEISGDVLRPDGKAVALENIVEKEDLSSHDRVVVADDRNNLPLVRLCKMSIGYNPDFILSAKSDFVIRGDLSKILPLLSGKTPARIDRSFSKSDMLHEAIHISGISVPYISAYILSDYTVALLIMAVASAYAISEILRMLGRSLPIFSTIALKAADESELQEFVLGPIFYAFGIILSLLLFRPPVSYASIAILTLGDSSAAIIGKRFGRTVFPLNKGKRVEGSVAGLVFAFCGSLLFVDPLRAFIGAFAGILAEYLPSPIDDNVTIPLVSGLALTLSL